MCAPIESTPSPIQDEPAYDFESDALSDAASDGGDPVITFRYLPYDLVDRDALARVVEPKGCERPFYFEANRLHIDIPIKFDVAMIDTPPKLEISLDFRTGAYAVRVGSTSFGDHLLAHWIRGGDQRPNDSYRVVQCNGDAGDFRTSNLMLDSETDRVVVLLESTDGPDPSYGVIHFNFVLLFDDWFTKHFGEIDTLELTPWCETIGWSLSLDQQIDRFQTAYAGTFDLNDEPFEHFVAKKYSQRVDDPRTITYVDMIEPAWVFDKYGFELEDNRRVLQVIDELDFRVHNLAIDYETTA